MERYKPSRIFYVYVLFRPDTGQPCYVGKGKNKRWVRQAVQPESKHLRNIIVKFGKPLIPIKVRDGLTEREAFETEVALIKALGRRDCGGPLVNLTDGGEGTVNMPLASRASIATKTKKRMSDPAQRANIGNKNKERQADPLVRAELRARMLAQRADSEKGALLRKGHSGRSHSPEAVAIISQKAALRMQDPKRRAAISLKLMGNVPSVETLQKRSASMLIYWNELRARGLSTKRPAKDEAARRAAIKTTMLAYRARIRDVEFGDDLQ